MCFHSYRKLLLQMFSFLLSSDHMSTYAYSSILTDFSIGTSSTIKTLYYPPLNATNQTSYTALKFAVSRTLQLTLQTTRQLENFTVPLQKVMLMQDLIGFSTKTR